MEDFEKFVRDNSKAAQEFQYGLMSELLPKPKNKEESQYWFEMGFFAALGWLQATFGLNLVGTDNEIEEIRKDIEARIKEAKEHE